jgi:hypothetical protein
MKGRSAFDIDLAFGQGAEGRLGAILAASGSKIEVKSDRKAHLTGNIYVEYASRGKDSGIRTTEAEWYCYEIAQSYWMLFPTSLLRMYVEEKLQERGPVPGGDFNTSRGVLVNLDEFRKWVVPQ